MKIEDYDLESSNMITSGLCDEDLNILSYKKINIHQNWFIWLNKQYLYLIIILFYYNLNDYL